MPAEAVALPLAVGEPMGRISAQSGPEFTGGSKLIPRERGRMVSQTLSRADDTLLIREAQRGNRAAFEELVRQYDQAVLRLALNLTRSEQDAQDIFQEAFLKAYRNLGSFRFECSFYTWVYRIVTNLCLDHLRKKQVRKEEAPVAVDQQGVEYDRLDRQADDRAGSNPERDLMQRELGHKIGRALERLTPRERMVFELKHYLGIEAAHHRRDAQHHRGYGQEHAVPRHPETAGHVVGDAMSAMSKANKRDL